MMKRTISLLLSFIVFFQTGFLSVSALSNSSLGSYALNASFSEYITLGDSTFRQTQHLEDNGNNTYTLTVSLSSKLSSSDQNENPQQSQNHYFTATQSGEYLIELWGGNGADGQDTSYSGGGKGGSGGHIYGVIYLEAGDTLYYTLGGNGSQTSNADSGGGVNGDGGHHGEIGSYMVGGGGGYAAVYLFDTGEFEEKYTDDNGNLQKDIEESDRTSKYIMIAAGGGGGGAGNGFSIGGSATGTPDGGDGGSVGGNYGVISGAGYDVPGTFFAGSDGSSSGTSASYVGHGATNVPGFVSDTITTIFDVEAPNDWKGTYNNNTAGGAGGAGNMRGGSGGAGFCGGSGGIMTGLLVPTNVGGGGGGSSFIADNVDYNDLSDEIKALLENENPSATGGAVNITFVGEQTPEDNNFTLSGTVSEYFDVENIVASSGEITLEGDTFTVTGAHLAMSDGGESGTLSVSLLLRPKNGFAGGNNVPLLENGIVTCVSGDNTANIVLHEDCSAVNVPLDFTVITHSYVTNIRGQTYSVSQLYTDNYADVRNELSYHWQYDFIDSIGEYIVSDSSGVVLQASGTITALETSSYTVAFTVTPKSGTPAAVGEPVEEQQFFKTATITLFSSNSGELNGNRLDYTKSLTYDENTDTYELSLRVKTGTDTSYKNINPIRSPYSEEHANLTVIVPADGYYMIQLWGGNGGKGNGNNGGSGGSGGYVQGVVYLTAGETLTARIGKNGNDGSSSRSGGVGGQSTYMQIDTAYSMIAGGGGGGGGYGGLDWGLVPGSPGTSSSSTSNSYSGSPDDYNGENGENGSLFAGGGAGGEAGGNFRDGSVLTDASGLSAEAQSLYDAASQSDYTNNGGGGAVYITPLQLDKNQSTATEDIESALSGYLVDVDISDYFTIESVSVQNFRDSDGSTWDCVHTQTVSGQHLSVTDIDPEIIFTETTDANGLTEITGGAGFDVRVRLSVREGFLGGNDVPVLSYDNIDNSTGMKLSQGESSLQINRQGANNPSDPNKSDFANVSIRYNADLSGLETYDKNYILGDPGIAHSELFSYESSTDYTWEDDFVEFIDPNDVTTVYTPSATTSIPIEVGIRPLTETPVKASVGPVAVEESASKDAVIHVLYQVVYNLTNLHTDDTPDDETGRYLVEPEQAYSAVIIADTGAIRPAQITVTVGGRTLAVDEYTYDPRTGDFLIPAEQVTGNIEITAGADMMEYYTIHYVYEASPGSQEIMQYEQEYEVGAQLGEKFSDTYDPTEYTGYTFGWDWGADEGIATMPRRDIWVFGTYTAIEHNLTIEYVDEMGNKLFDDHTETLTYGSVYNVVSPVKSGYLADMLTVSGTIEGDTVIRVTYSPTGNQLNIIYIYKDSNTVFETHNETVETDVSYSVPSPVVPGYTADLAEVSGVMTAEGVTVSVYYSPNTYTVTFDANGGNCTVTEKTIVYNDIYGYDGTAYAALPTPIRVGYEFTGWYLGDTLITEETPVTRLEDHTLTAGWKGTEYQLTVRYLYENGLPAADEFTVRVAFGENYSVTPPDIPGYTAVPSVVAGTMPAQNTIVTVTYQKNSFLLTIRYLYEDGREAYPEQTQEVMRGTAYSVPSPAVTGHTPDIDYVQGEGLTEDTTFTVTYFPNEYTLTVHYRNENGTQLFEDYTAVLHYGSAYSIQSPEYAGYTPSIPVVSGTMGATDQEVTVIYYPGEVPEIISVDIEWGELSYEVLYTDWNPDTHSYGTTSIDPQTAGANYVKITNRSTINVSANVTVAIDSGYAQYFGSYFTENDAKSDPALTVSDFVLETDGVGNNKTLWLWLNEANPDALSESGLGGNITVGSCTVSIAKVGE